MDYNIMFDDYTVATQEFYKVYSSSLYSVRGKYCIDRIMNAINEKNYKFVYENLNPILKNNYYPTIEDFENFVTNNFYEKNAYEIDKDVKKIGKSVYQYSVKVIDNTTENAQYYRQFLMTVEIKEKADFTISIVLDML